MSGTLLAGLMFGLMLVLMAVRIPVALSMFLVGSAGYLTLVGLAPYLNYLKATPYFLFSNYTLSVIPLFILMGALAEQSGISRALFTAANSLLTACGLNLSHFIYNRVIQRQAEPSLQPVQTYRVGRRLLDPVRDYCAFRQLHAKGEITLKAWVASLLHRQTFAYFSMTDPLPAVACT